MGNGSEQGHGAGELADVVVGLDGSAASAAALRWAAAHAGPEATVHAVRVLEPDTGGVPGRAEAEAELRTRWIANAMPGGIDPRVSAVLAAGNVADALVRIAGDVGADAIVLGHHAQPHHGPQLVGHVTARLLHEADRAVVVVPREWDPDRTEGMPVAIGVGVARGTEVALRWVLDRPGLVGGGLLLVHAYGPRSVFRPEGWLDVLAYHLDPTVLPEWVEQDLLDLAEELQREAGTDVDVAVSVLPGRRGARLVEAGTTASLLVVGRSEPPFLSHAIAPYLRHAIVHSPSPVVVVPADAS